MAKPKKEKPAKRAKVKAVNADGADGAAIGMAKKTSLVGQALTAAIAAITAFGVVYFLPDDSPPHETPLHADRNDVAQADKYNFDAALEFADLDPFTLSLSDGQTILKIGIVLEVYTGEAYAIDPSDPQIRNAFMGYLRALQVEHIRDPAFMDNMRMQLRRRARLVLGQETVKDILITDFIIQ